MKKSLFVLMMLVASMTASAQFTSAPAFPGAEGYGRYTTGGRGGTVYHVTNLNDSGTGSLRAAVEASGKRIVVFDIDGTITLESRLSIKNPNITILGQTAPGQGICLKGNSFYISANNVIVRYIRCRMGDFGIDDDAMSSGHHDGSECKNIIIDHCSMSWCTDEVGSFYGNENFTLQWCILSESLKTSSAKEGTHGFGGIWGGKKATFHHNLLAHNDSRMPRFDHGYVSTLTGPVDYVNNVVYDWGGNSTYGGENNEGCESKKFNIINNYYKPGPSTSSSCSARLLNPSTTCENCTGTNVPMSAYIKGNYMVGSTAVTNDNTCSPGIKMDSNTPVSYATWKSNYLSSSPFTTDEEQFQYNLVSMQKPADAYSLVAKYAGCSFNRDAVDTRISKELTNKTGAIITSTSANVNWPALTAGTAKVDTDGDGMPDEWETAHGLNAKANDAARYNLDSKRYYTNIEVYAASLVEEDVKAERASATETFEEYYPDYQNGESSTEETKTFYAYIEPTVSADDHSTITFSDGAKLVLTGKTANADGKKYSGATAITVGDDSDKSIKLSNGAMNTFYAPEGKFITNITFYSYVNADSGDSYWSKVGDNTYDASSAEIMKSFKNAANPDVRSYDLSGVSSVEFKNSGKQLCFVMVVTYGVATGIASLSNDSTAKTYYNIAGQRVSDTSKGIVITKGRKVIIR